jgi:hypothetical protein
MKVYVRDYRPRDPEQIPPGPTTEHVVEYSKEPEWIMEFVQQANDLCLTLHSGRAHVDSHLCQFTVEELPKGGFAVV